MELFGVINASPDSLNEESKVDSAEATVARARQLLRDGADAIDIGGAGSTPQASRVSVEEEWSRLDGPVRALADLGVSLSVDTWQAEVARRGLEAGATWMNAADGLQDPEMVALAVDAGCPVVLPFLSGRDPKAMRLVKGDPVVTIIEWFETALTRVELAGIRRDQLVLDPGTGFAPPGWEWEDRYQYQRQVYTELDRLRVFGLPLYVALPWKETAQHDELLEIVLRSGVEYGRAHFPARVRAVERDTRT